jgi:hypothetical protein
MFVQPSELPSSRFSGLSAALAILCITLLACVALWASHRSRRRTEEARLARFALDYNFTLITSRNRLEAVLLRLNKIFGIGAQIERSFVHMADDRLVFELVYFRVPDYRVEADGTWDARMQQSSRRLSLIVSGFASTLPTFRLIPSSWAVRALRGRDSNRLETIEPFGRHSHLSTPEPERARRVLDDSLLKDLQDNRQLAIESRTHVMAFYLGDGEAIPHDYAHFFALCQDISRRVGTAAEDVPSSRTQSIRPAAS